MIWEISGNFIEEHLDIFLFVGVFVDFCGQIRSQEGQSRGMGQCTFQVPSQAAAAIKVLRDRDVGGRPIWIAEDVPWLSHVIPHGRIYDTIYIYIYVM